MPAPEGKEYYPKGLKIYLSADTPVYLLVVGHNEQQAA